MVKGKPRAVGTTKAGERAKAAKAGEPAKAAKAGEPAKAAKLARAATGPAKGARAATGPAKGARAKPEEASRVSRALGREPSRLLGDDFAEEVYRFTKMVPRGQVATYGQIATYVASPRYARAVGTALRNLPRARSKEIPWHRVLNAGGRISARGDVERPDLQLRKLRAEGVVFDASGKTNLLIFGWRGPR